MTRLCSFDTSTNKSGVATFDDGNLIDYQLFDCSKIKDVEERINNMGKLLLSYLIKQKPDMIVIEHPQGAGSNVSMVNKLSEILGIVRGYAIAKNIHYEEFTPSVWRRHCNFNQGKKKRDELKQMSIYYVKDNFKIDVNDDVADAISLGCGVFNYCRSLEENELFE